MEKEYSQIKLRSNKDAKQSEDGILFERAVQATIQIFYEKTLSDNYDNADKILKD